MSKGRTRDATYKFADQISLRHEVISRRRARFPPRSLCSQSAGAKIPVGEVLGIQRCLKAGESRGVAHDVANLDGFLAPLGEFRPILGHRSVEVELAAIMKHQRDEEGHSFR